MRTWPQFVIALAAAPSLAHAQPASTYPTKPIRVVTAPAGAGNDFMARVISQGLSSSMGQQLVVDNRPAGLIGELVAKAPADGYTLLAVGSVLWLTPFLQDNVGYDPVKESELVQYLRSGAVVERLSGIGVEPVASTPRELADAMQNEMTRMGKLIKDARLRGP